MNVALDRRRLLKGLAGLPLATILADPELARAQAANTKPQSLTTQGGRQVTGALALPAILPAPAIVLVHEWWGLNDQIKSVAVELANLGYVALALDLMGGQVATTPDQATKQVQAVDPAAAGDIASSWIGWARTAKPPSNGRVGIIGWCFGGGWSLIGSTLASVDATVLYYGKCDLPADQLAHLKGPVLGHFGEQDPRMNHEMVAKFESAMKQDGKAETVYWYDAPHAFANPTGANYHKPEAQLAWNRTLDFLAKNLKG